LNPCPCDPDRATLVAIRGAKQRVVNAFVVFDDGSDAEPVLYVSVETRKRKGTAPPKQTYHGKPARQSQK
jgi:hypothetical protein